MAVEILVLTGNRRGERYRTEQGQFLVGGNPQCDFLFDTELDSGARDRQVAFAFEETGWTLQNTGDGDILLNNRPVIGAVRVRSGDVVRLSHSGPDFSFQVTSAVGSQNAAALPTGQDAALPHAPASARAPSPPTTTPFIAQSVTATALGAAVILLICLATWSVLKARARPAPIAMPSRPTVNEEPPPQPQSENAGDEISPTTTKQASDDPRVDPGMDVQTPEPGPSPQPTPVVADDPWFKLQDALRSSVYLLAVEQPKTEATWTFASGCAIGDRTIMTSGNVIAELADFQNKGWTIWAINESANIKTEITSLLVHAGYQKTTSEPEERIYFDIGLAGVAGPLPASASLATPESLSQLEPGYVIACIGFPRQAETLTRFDSHEPELFPAKVFIVTTLPPAPGPRLLHFRADISVKPYGGALVTPDGRVCAVYAESAAIPSDGAGDLKIHYAPVVDRELIDAGLTGTARDVWITPHIPNPPAMP